MSAQDLGNPLAVSHSTTILVPVPVPLNVNVDAAPIPIVLYTPLQLYVDGDPANGFRPRTRGTLGTTTWAGLARLLSRAPEGDPKKYPDPNVQKSARGGWSACSLTEGRRLGSAFIETCLLGLDIDKRGHVEQALRAFEPFKKIVHSTYKSTEVAPRCRVLLFLKGTCRDAETFRRAHHAVRQAVVQAGWFHEDDFDDAGSDLSRLWFLPIVPPGSPYTFHVTEGVGLGIYDIDIERGTVHIRHGKGNKERVVPIGERALAWVGKYLDVVRPEVVVDGSDETLFLNRLREPMGPDALTARVRGYVKESGIGKKGSCHLFRHTMATLMLEGGADVRYVQEMLGHTKLETTQIYTQVSIGKLRDVYMRSHPAARLGRARRETRGRRPRCSPPSRPRSFLPPWRTRPGRRTPWPTGAGRRRLRGRCNRSKPTSTRGASSSTNPPTCQRARK